MKAKLSTVFTLIAVLALTLGGAATALRKRLNATVER